jgi:hypothetical protein
MGARRTPIVELLVAAWVAIWILMGYFVSSQVRGIASLGDTVVLAGHSIEQTADALDAARNIPFVGGNVHRLALQARRTARSAIVNGAQARGDVDRLAVLLWLTIALAPSLPAIGWYVWIRRRGADDASR